MNTFEAYQNTALVLEANEQGKGQRPDVTFVTAGPRKHLLTKVLEGNMTPDEKKFTMHGERPWKPFREPLHCAHADEKLTAFVELELAIRASVHKIKSAHCAQPAFLFLPWKGWVTGVQVSKSPAPFNFSR